MIICDTSVLVAALDSRDDDHTSCAVLLSRQIDRLVTTLPCITEALYLLGKGSGSNGQEALRNLVARDALTISYSSPTETKRAFALMREYADAPMDFADASLVALAETLGISRILTLDHHFYAYLIHGTTPFDVSP